MCGFRPSDLTGPGWNDICCVGMGRQNLISVLLFIPQTTRPVIFSLVISSSARTVESFRWTSGPFMLSFSRADILIKQASDLSLS